ncbi:hypothetical protein IGI04_007322 [Brassica rapa subsp. trilocularis]|uniref:Uncharacterized protein n=1 Tax=Brassica rapa subsp. trilocularis TaxID=1813537 RepID=A0ABQ7NJE0_BRACM|nr:hypothetical protein IGI04_007322 [Brassica rapa subsp. trilocularis]
MAVDEHGEPTEAAQTTAELQKQIDGLQGQITDMHRARETTGENPDLSSEVQNLKEKLDEHSKQLEQSAEKLSKLQSENTVLRDQNQALNATGNKKRHFNTRIRPMGNLNTPNFGEGTTDTPPTSGVAGSTREGTENPQIHVSEESDFELDSEKEAPERAAATERQTPNHSKNQRNPLRTYVDRSAWSPPKPFEVASARKTWSSQDPRPPPHIDKITKSLIRHLPVVSRIKKWGMTTSRRPPQRVHRTDTEQRAPHRRRRETLSQAGGLQTWSLRRMNVTTRFMEVLKSFINRRQWSLNTKGRGMKRVSTTVPRPKKEAEPCRRRRNPPARTLVPKASPRDLRSWPTLNDKVHPLSLIVAFCRKQHAARELDSDQLPNGRMRYPNRYRERPHLGWQNMTSGSKDHMSNLRPQGPDPTGSLKMTSGS